jgi:DNA-damage-inducible protein D
MTSDIKLFQQQKVRTHWDEEKGQWYFSVIDVIEILTGSSILKRYWTDLKKKLAKEGSQLYEKIVQLKLKAADEKMYATDCLQTQDLLRLIQSIPSPKAEPFKQWLAKTGYERMQEIVDPAQSIDRARDNWKKLGRSEKCLPAGRQGYNNE